MLTPINEAVPGTLNAVFKQTWRFEAILNQADVVLINHTQGPNMPLMRLRLRDVFILGVNRKHHAAQFDLLVPVECQAYNQETEVAGFEALLAPAIIALRCNFKPHSNAVKTNLSHAVFRRHSLYDEHTVRLSVSPVNVVLTQLSLGLAPPVERIPVAQLLP